MRQLALVVVVLALVLPCAASASTVEEVVVGAELHGNPTYGLLYTADAGEQNALTITSDSAGIHVRDPGATVHPGDRCVQSGLEVLCSPQVEAAAIDLGDRPDTLDNTLMNAKVSGGAGGDTLRSPGTTFDGGPDADVMEGTGGYSDVVYRDRTAGVSVTLDGAANDGEPGEGDNVTGQISGLTGGAGDDVLSLAGEPASTRDGFLEGNGGADHLIGGAVGDRLSGDSGDDELSGAAGDDILDGGLGDDHLAGGDGTDTAEYSNGAAGVHVTPGDGAADGAPGENDQVDGDVEDIDGTRFDDLLQGTAAANELEGFGGDDALLGEGGADRLLGDVGNDRLVGGPGPDRAFAYGNDRLEFADGEPDQITCAQEVTSIEADMFDIAPRCRARIDFTPARTRRTASDGRVHVKIRCTSIAGRRCDGALRMIDRHDRRPLGTGAYHLANGERQTIGIKLNAAGRHARDTRYRVPIMILAYPDGAAAVPDVEQYFYTRSAWATKQRR
jgi:hypothetical protein